MGLADEPVAVTDMLEEVGRVEDDEVEAWKGVLVRWDVVIPEAEPKAKAARLKLSHERSPVSTVFKQLPFPNE